MIPFLCILVSRKWVTVRNSKFNVGRLQKGLCRLGIPRLGRIERGTDTFDRVNGNFIGLKDDLGGFCFAMMGDEVDEIRIGEAVSVHSNRRTIGSSLHHGSYRSESEEDDRWGYLKVVGLLPKAD